MNKKWMAALAIPALTVTGVGVASAQTADDDTNTDSETTENTESTEQNGRRGGRRGGRGLGNIAEALGMAPGDLRDAVQSGQTIAEVAAANGVDIDQVIADMVAEAQTRADDAGRDNFDADALTERLTAAVNGEVDFSERQGRRGGKGLRGSSDAVQELLGLEGDAIREALRDGDTLADVAEDQGVSLDELVSTIVDDIETRIADRNDGDLPDDFDVDALTDRVTERVTTPKGERGPGGAPDAESTSV